MERGEIFFEFTQDNVVVKAVCLDTCNPIDYYDGSGSISYLCYAQNSIFYYIREWDAEGKTRWLLGLTVVDYCTIPEIDAILESHK